MRRNLILAVLMLAPLIASGGRGSFDAKIIDFRETGNDEYVLRMIQLSQPYGYEHKHDTELVIHLRFQCPRYECDDAESLPTLEEYHQAIELLKNQMTVSDIIKFGIVDRGYARIEGTKDEYQSNALEVYDGIVCSNYDFFDL